MTIVIFSSVFNHHSLPLCDALNSLEGVRCYFVATQCEEDERKKLGYHSYDRDYVIDMYSSEENEKLATSLALGADVMIAGVFPYELLEERLKRNKLTFLCQERMFKGGATFARRLRSWFYNMRKFARFKNKPLYFLSMGDGAAKDYASIGFYKHKSFRWAYFTHFEKYDIDALMENKPNDLTEILFVGRLIPLKNPDYPLKAVKSLIAEGHNLHLTYIGSGELEQSLRREADSLGDSVTFLGSMPPEKVREYMEKANIFTFTSNSMEGWGAVVNEAMNSACAVVASDAPGSVMTMIKHGENALTYPSENYDEFYLMLKKLVTDRKLTDALGIEAYKTIRASYNAEVAAKRFVACCEKMLSGESPVIYTEGIMQKI